MLRDFSDFSRTVFAGANRQAPCPTYLPYPTYSQAAQPNEAKIPIFQNESLNMAGKRDAAGRTSYSLFATSPCRYLNILVTRVLQTGAGTHP